MHCEDTGDIIKGILKRNGREQSSSSEFAPALFIVGVPRSGTTLLRLMCDAHPELSIPPEMGFIPEVADLRGRGDELRQTFFDVVTGMATWRDANIKRARFEHELDEIAPFRLGGREGFLSHYAGRFGSRVGRQDAAYCLHMDKIEKLLPEARFVPSSATAGTLRSRCASLVLAGDRIEQLAHLWRRGLCGASSRRRRRHYMEIRYED